jgi:CheY-like chemotaxis protein
MPLMKRLSSSTSGRNGFNRDLNRPNSPPQTTYRGILDAIDTSARGLLSVVNNLIQLDRLGHENEQIPLTCANVLLCDVEKEVVDTAMLHAAQDKLRDVTFLCDSRIPADLQCYTDSTLLVQCLSNLAQNALAFTDSGTVKLQSAIEDEETLVYDVIDTGSGIEPADQERIFAAFERAAVRQRGLGLSLSIAARLAVALSGSITLMRSAPNQGSHFQVRIPHAQLSKQVGAGNATPASGISFGVDTSQRTPQLDSALQLLERCGSVLSTPKEADVLLLDARSTHYSASHIHRRLQPTQLAICLIQDDIDEAFFLSISHTKALSARIVPLRAPVLTSRVQLALYQLDGLRSACAASATAAPFRSLLVDDDPVNLRILCMYCKKRNIDSVAVRDGREAVDEYQKAASAGQPFSLILMGETGLLNDRRQC